jgi:pimeloyl-ACP methyl ester carboxylesterase
MKRPVFACVLALSTLWFATPAQASTLPLPAARASFNAGTLRVDVYGTPGKTPLIFIPGLLCGPWEWAGEIRRFSGDYTIYALTLPGFDRQPAVAGDLFAHVSADIWNLLEAKHIEKPIVVGHSLGGTLGLMLAEQHPNRLRALVAVDGMPILPGMESASAPEREAFAQRTASMIRSLATPAQFEAAEKTYSLPFLMTSPADIDAVAPLAARSDPAASAAWMQADMTLDLRAQLASIAIPVLEIVPFDPKLDAKGPAHLTTAQAKQAYYTSLLRGVPSLTVQAIQPSRHFVMYDQPAALDETIARFVTSVERSENRERPSGS